MEPLYRIYTTHVASDSRVRFVKGSVPSYTLQFVVKARFMYTEYTIYNLDMIYNKSD